jgi:hypothetical protein
MGAVTTLIKRKSTCQAEEESVKPSVYTTYVYMYIYTKQIYIQISEKTQENIIFLENYTQSKGKTFNLQKPLCSVSAVK